MTTGHHTSPQDEAIDLTDRDFTPIVPISTIPGIPTDGGGLFGRLYDGDDSLDSIPELEALIDANAPDATFLAKTVDFSGGLTIAEFLGDEAVLDPETAAAANVSLQTFGLALTGLVYIPAGLHTIAVRSDDGFRLSLNGEEISSHLEERTAAETTIIGDFEAGFYELELLYFENLNGQSLRMEIDGEVVSQNAFYESVEAFEDAAANTGEPLIPADDFHPSTVFGPTAGSPAPEIAIGDLGDIPLAGAGLVGVVYDAESIHSITDFARLIGAGLAPSATFEASAIDYGDGASNESLADFLGPDGGSIVGDADLVMDGVGITLNGFIALPEGEHSITVRSDDGFVLLLGGAEVARFEGRRGADETTVNLDLEGGLYKIELAYFDSTGGQSLVLEVDGLPVDGSAYYPSVASFEAQQAAADGATVPVEDYHPGKVLGPEAYGAALSIEGADEANRIVGLGDDDHLEGGREVDHITGGYGDDFLDGGSGDDVLDGGRGSDLLIGGAGDDLLIARSDAGEQRIGQLAIDQRGRGDPDGEVNDARQKLAGWESQPLKADDILVGGSGADVFLIAPLINAKQDIIEKHVRSDGTIDWARVAGENNEVHDHWVDAIGIDVIADYHAGEDTIAIIGHTAVPIIQARRDVDGDDDLETIITIYSNQHGGGGAHNRDLIGQVIVHGDAVDLDDIVTDNGVTYGIVENYSDLAEALFPTGPAKETVTIEQEGGFIDAGTGAQDPANTTIEAAYDTRTFDPDTGDVDLGAVTGRPEDHIDNPFLHMLDELDADPSTRALSNSRAPFAPRAVSEDRLTEIESDIPPAIGFWRFDDIADGVGADSRGGPDVVAYRHDENRAIPRLEGAQTEGPVDDDGLPTPGASTGALYFDGEHDFAFIEHRGDYQVSHGSIALWLRPDDLSDDQIVVSKDLRNSGEGGHFRLGHEDDGRIFLRMAEGDGGGNKSWTSAASYLDEGQWTHIAVSFTDEGVTVYVDGRAIPDFAWVRQEGNVDAPGEYTEAYLIQNQEPWILGADTSSTEISGTAAKFALDAQKLDDAFEGAIADFGIWGGYTADAALTASQVVSLVQNGPSEAMLNAPATPAAGVMDGQAQEVVGTDAIDQIDGLAGDDILSGGDSGDTINGDYGDDQLSGDAGDDVLDGGRGSDLLLGGDGDDLLISRSDAGEQRIGQLAIGQPTREDPDGEVDPTYQKLFGWEDQPLVADDIMVGGAGRDTFLFNPLINAKLDIILEHVEDNRWIDWAGVAGETNEVHDHWVDSFGIDVIADFVAGEDEIVIVGHTAAPEVSYKLLDTNGDGVADDLISIITVYSKQHGGGGAHDRDLMGQIVVYGDAVDAGSIVTSAGVTHGIVETIDDIVEALAPTPGEAGRKSTGTLFQIDPLTGEAVDVTIGYDSRSYRIDENGGIIVDLGDVIRNPDAYVENKFADQVTFQSAFPDGEAPTTLLETGPVVLNDDQPFFEIVGVADLAGATGSIIATFTANSPGDEYQAIWSQDANGYEDGGHHTAWIDPNGHIKVRYQSETESAYLEARGVEIEAGETYTVAFAFDGETARLYVDGMLQDEEDAFPTGTLGNEESIVLGASTIYRTSGELNNLRDFFDGRIHNFEVLDKPITLAELILRQEAADFLDQFDILETSAAAEKIEGGDGQDTVSYAESSAGVKINLTNQKSSGGDADGDSLTSIEHVVGSSHDDVLVGDAGANMLSGGAGSDRLNGRDGDDLLFGGDGNDIYRVDDVGDQVMERAGEGRDKIHTTVDFMNPDNVEALSARYSDSGVQLTGNSGRETLTGANVKKEGDMIAGLGGNDKLIGLVGDDNLHGGAGNDKIYGNSGDDVINGGADNDALIGKQGADTFVFDLGSGVDVIKDFTAGLDKIDISAYGFESFDDLDGVLADVKGRAQLNLNGNEDVIRLNGVLVEDMSAGDFIFA